MSCPAQYWASIPWLGVDLETTGLDVFTVRMVTAALVYVDPTDRALPPQSRGYLTDPGVEIPAEPAKVHGITTEFAREYGSDYGEVYRDVRTRLDEHWGTGGAVIAYNAAFDLSILHHEGVRLGYPHLAPGVVIDPMVIDRAITRSSGTTNSRRLKPTTEVHRVRHDIEHDAVEDVLATLRIAYRLRSHPLGQWTPDRIMWQQERWYRQRAEDLREYYRKHPGRRDPESIATDWPIQHHKQGTQ